MKGYVVRSGYGGPVDASNWSPCRWRPGPTGDEENCWSYGFAAFESLDGKTLYYTKGLSVPGIWRVPTSGGEESEVLRMPETGFWGFWAPVRDGIYYLDTSVKPRINFLNLLTHKTTRVFDLDNPARQTPGLTVSPDGTTILFTQEDQYKYEIAVIQGFH